MSDEEWRVCDDPFALLALARDGLSPRRLRLLAVGCVTLIADHASYPECFRAVEVACRLADGRVTRREVAAIRRGVETHLRGVALPRFQYPIYAHRDLLMPDAGAALDSVLYWTRESCLSATEKYRVHMLGVVRCVVENPAIPALIEPEWMTEAVIGLARGVSADRAYSRLPVLADALEDAGCNDPRLLEHLRGQAPHYRGCWAVDRILGLE